MPSERPRLVSLRGANVENLALGNLDLSACRFVGAHGLDELRITADCEFAQPPPQRRYTRRRTLAEEHHWQAAHATSAPVPAVRQRWRDAANAARRHWPHRARTSSPTGWHPGKCQPPEWLEPPAAVLDPARIAAIYRALRKALEDRNDEPGAADFYYGEMQMRTTPPRGRDR